MRIGLINQLNGRPDGEQPPPMWESISARAEAAERAGFDVFVFEDALLYRTKKGTNGLWESMSIGAALAATTERINVGQSVVNSPYRSPAMTAVIATTLDEISNGRYVLGIGAGNTPDSEGPPINIAAGGPKMLGLVARYADQWNWWGYDETLEQIRARLEPILKTLELAMEEEGRDPETLTRTLDLYSIVPPGLDTDHERSNLVTGSADQIAEFILELGELGFQEVRCDLLPKTIDAVEAMAPVVELVQD